MGLLAVLVSAVVITGTVSALDLNPAGPGDERIVLDEDTTEYLYIRQQNGVVSSVDNTGWTTVNLLESYNSMVVIVTPNYDGSDPPLVPRVQNASGSSFDVRVDRFDGSAAAISGIDVHWLVLEEGVYPVADYGVQMEAVKFTSTVTDRKASWSAEVRAYAQSYTTPVVLGQVMTYNDADPSASGREPALGRPLRRVPTCVWANTWAKTQIPLGWTRQLATWLSRAAAEPWRELTIRLLWGVTLSVGLETTPPIPIAYRGSLRFLAPW